MWHTSNCSRRDKHTPVTSSNYFTTQTSAASGKMCTQCCFCYLYVVSLFLPRSLLAAMCTLIFFPVPVATVPCLKISSRSVMLPRNRIRCVGSYTRLHHGSPGLQTMCLNIAVLHVAYFEAEVEEIQHPHGQNMWMNVRVIAPTYCKLIHVHVCK